MDALAIPLAAFLVVLVLAVVFSRRDIYHPRVVLSGVYVVMAVFSCIYAFMNNAWAHFPKDANTSSTLLALLITVSLIPSFFIKKPDLDLGLIKRSVGKMTFGIAAIFGAVGFFSLLPVFMASLSIDAYSSKTLGETAVLVASTPYLIIGSFFSAFSCIFGLLLFCDTRMELSWIVRIGLVLGLLNYGIMMECNKGRESMVYYLFFFIFYFWLFGNKWQFRMRVFFFSFLACSVLILGMIFFAKTVQRFGHSEPGSATLVEGTVGYLGQQVANFIEVAEEPDIIEGHAEINFPVYFYVVRGEWVDALKLLNNRKRIIEFSFSTYVGTLFLAIGRWWTVAALLVTAVLAGMLFSRPPKRFPETYVVGIMLYYQSLFQGVFYWMQGGRFGNGFVISMVCLGIVLYGRRLFGRGDREVRC